MMMKIFQKLLKTGLILLIIKLYEKDNGEEEKKFKIQKISHKNKVNFEKLQNLFKSR